MTRDRYGYATQSPLIFSDPGGLTTTKCDFQLGEHAFGCLHIEGTGEYVSSITFHYFDLRERCPYFSNTDFVVARVSIDPLWGEARKVDYGTYYVTEGQAFSEDTHESGYFANGTEVCVQFFYRKETTNKRQKTGPGDPITDNICATIHR